jgi:putative membrane protein (TIGR04086 family)
MPNYVSKRRPRRSASSLWQLVKAALIACLAVLGAIALMTLLLYLGWAGERAIPIFNAIVKVLGAALAGFIVSTGVGEKPWLMGAGAGFVFSLLSTLVLLLMSSEPSFNWSLLTDAVIAACVGAAVCALTSLISRKE